MVQIGANWCNWFFLGDVDVGELGARVSTLFRCFYVTAFEGFFSLFLAILCVAKFAAGGGGGEFVCG
jgi:hypothetical protein